MDQLTALASQWVAEADSACSDQLHFQPKRRTQRLLWQLVCLALSSCAFDYPLTIAVCVIRQNSLCNLCRHPATNCLGTATFGHPVCPGSAIDDDGRNGDLYLSSSRLRFFADVFFFRNENAGITAWTNAKTGSRHHVKNAKNRWLLNRRIGPLQSCSYYYAGPYTA